MKEENVVLSSPLAGEDVRRTGEGYIKENTYLNPLIGFECLRTQNHFPRQGGSQTASGFTLIELLVVVLIIGILAAVAVPQYQKAVTKSKVASVMPLFRAVANAEETYYLANNQYTNSYEELAIALPAGTTVSGTKATLPNGTKIILQTSGYMYTSINEDKEKGAIQLNYWFAHGIGKNHSPFECFAAVADETGISICKSFSNKEPTSGNCVPRGEAEPCKGYAMY